MKTDEQRQSGKLWSEMRQWTDSGSPALAGAFTGLASLAVSFGLRGANLGRPLADPVPLMLAITQLTNGFTYFPWRPALTHLIFAVLLGFSALTVISLLSKGRVTPKKATQAGRIAALINVLIVATLEVDAIVVGFWYLVSGLASVLITGLVAGVVASWLARRQGDKGS
jgi:hypothetical protein